MRQTVNLFIVAMCVAVPAMAQDFQQAPALPQQPPRVAAPTMPPAPQRVTAPTMTPPAVAQRATPTPPAAEAPAAPQRQVDPRIDQSDVNIKLTVKITDSNASGTQTKVVSLIMANRGNGRVRSSGVSVGPPERSSDLNVDARATLYKSGAISTNLTISYSPERNNEEQSKLVGVSQSVELFLKDGTPTVITQAADPTKGSRSVTIEVTATVVK